YESAALAERVPALVDTAERLGELTIVVQNLGVLASADDLRGLVTAVRSRLASESAVVALAASIDDKPAVIVGTNEPARARGAKAGQLAKTAAGVLGGGGGGKDDLAQGGGSKVEAIADALDAIRGALQG